MDRRCLLLGQNLFERFECHFDSLSFSAVTRGKAREAHPLGFAQAHPDRFLARTLFPSGFRRRILFLLWSFHTKSLRSILNFFNNCY